MQKAYMYGEAHSVTLCCEGMKFSIKETPLTHQDTTEVSPGKTFTANVVAVLHFEVVPRNLVLLALYVRQLLHGGLLLCKGGPWGLHSWELTLTSNGR